MKLKFKRILISIITCCLFSQASWGQNSQKSEVTAGPRKQLATIIFAGLSGAILGLSTLSFYGRPQDRLSNIAVGFALGIFAGAIYSTYKAAARPDEFYSFEDSIQNRLMVDARKSPSRPIAGLSYQWTF